MPQNAGPNFNLGHKKQDEEVDLYSWADEERQESPKRSGRNSLWELDVKSLISSEKWLQLHGLKRNRLKLHQILARIGFKHTDSYIKSLKKPIGSYYGEGLFKQMKTNSGKTYNITVGKETLHDIENNLKKSSQLIRRRQEWLTCGSRKIFGVIQEHCICIVLDISTMVQSQFDMYREAICEVMQDQVAQLAKFNLIRAQSDILMWQESVVPVSDVTIKDSMAWIKGLDRMAEISNTSCTEAVIKACEDDSLEAVYLFTEGDVSESSKELLRQKLKESPVPLHAVSFNATKASTVQFLKGLSSETGGRFHAFVIKSEYEDDDDVVGKNGFQLNGSIINTMRLSQKSRGGLPHGAGVREDVFLIWRELEEARNILADMQTLISNMEEASEQMVESKALMPSLCKRQEINMSSKDWLLLHGLDSNKLTIFHALSSYAFKHIDDVIELQGKPADILANDAHQVLKLIEAKYCKNFPHMVWRDNQVVHVYVSAELFRTYERKMKTVLDTIQQRIDWLQQGSREVFGSILEERIYFLIDSSYSMGENLPVLKDKLMTLFQEQLRHKTEFNLVKFESRATSWKPRMEEISEDSLREAWQWVCELEPGGSTNTLAALRIALSDPNTEGIYLLTDGRPDQPLHCVLSQIQLRKAVPVHTISFNCHDSEANKFLHQLALDTGGRFHSYTTHGGLPHGPTPFESEDVSLLKAELEHGKEDLQKMSDLRARCVMLDWYYNRKSKGDTSDRRISSRMSSPPPSAPCCIEQKKSKSLPASPATYSGKDIPSRPSTALGIMSQPTLLEISHKHHRGQFGVNDESIYSVKQITSGDRGKDDVVDAQCSSSRKKKKPVNCSKKKQRNSEVKNSIWLKTNGLLPKKMTLMDVLGPTVIRQNRKFIPILNKHVLSKVFDDVLPIAHVSPRSKKEIRLVNPNAAHLEAYERELRKLLETYRERLNQQIWKHLPKEEQEKHGSKETFYYVRNPEYVTTESEVMEQVNTVLEEHGWPISKHEIQVLLDEIHLGEQYLEQSEALRKEAAENSLKAVKRENDKEKSAPRKVRRRQKRTPAPPPPKSETSETGSTTSDQSGDETYSTLSDSTHTTETTQSVDKDQERQQRNGRHTLKHILYSLAGERVIARSEFDGYYYDGILMQCLDMRYAHIKFDHGEDQITSTRFILPVSQNQLPEFQLGDHILAKTRSSAKEPVHYVPGIVIGLPGKQKLFPNHYKVLLCNNKKKKAYKKNLIKIDESRYKFAMQFIKSRLEKLGCGFETESSCSSFVSEAPPVVDTTTVQFTEVKEHIKVLQNMLDKQTEEINELRNTKPEVTKVVTREQMTSPVSFDVPKKPTFEDKGVQSDSQPTGPEPVYVSVDKKNKSMTIMSGETGLILSRQDMSNGQNQGQSKLQLDQEVLARFDDDGWYYRGTIKDIHDFDTYDVADANDCVARVTRDNVIIDEDDAKNDITLGDYVVAMHPSYMHSYAPATVVKVTGPLTYHVKFYDDSESTLPREEIYMISKDKYETNVKYIDTSEQRWEGQAVVARNDKDGQYHLAFCKKRIGRTRRFALQWSDGGASEQFITHMFGALSRKHDFEVGDHILAIADINTVTYLPGFVSLIKGETLTVDFISGRSSQSVMPLRSYYLSKEYYEQAVEYYGNLR